MWRVSWGGRGRQAPGKQRVLGSTRFLQYFLRRSRLLRPFGCWARAGLAGLIVYRQANQDSALLLRPELRGRATGGRRLHWRRSLRAARVRGPLWQ